MKSKTDTAALFCLPCTQGSGTFTKSGWRHDRWCSM